MSTAHKSPVLTADSTAAYRRHVEEAAAFVREQTPIHPEIGLILGTGREALLDDVDVEVEWTFDDIPNAPDGGDANRLLTVGTFAETPVAVLNRPLFLYDGYTPRQVTFPIRMLAETGVETLLFSNVAGSVHPEMEPSDLLLLTDHVNFQGANPLVGPNVEDWGPRFPDMSEPYDPRLRELAESVALQQGVKLHKGIYFAVLGPALGTSAECRMVRTLGADVVGTGTVPEVIAARHMDLRVLALSVIANRCAPDAGSGMTVEDGAEAVEAAQPQLRRLVRGIVTAVERESLPA